MLVLMPIVLASTELIEVPVTIKTLNGEVDLTIEGGKNSYSGNCSSEVDITQTLQVSREVECTAITDCEEDVDTLYAMFRDYSKQLNETFGGEGCVDVLLRNKELIKENANLKVGLNTTDNNWYDLYTQCNEERINLREKTVQPTYKGDYDKCQADRDKFKDDRLVWAIVGAIAGAGGCYGLMWKVKTVKSTSTRLGP